MSKFETFTCPARVGDASSTWKFVAAAWQMLEGIVTLSQFPVEWAAAWSPEGAGDLVVHNSDLGCDILQLLTGRVCQQFGPVSKQYVAEQGCTRLTRPGSRTSTAALRFQEQTRDSGENKAQPKASSKGMLLVDFRNQTPLFH